MAIASDPGLDPELDAALDAARLYGAQPIAKAAAHNKQPGRYGEYGTTGLRQSGGHIYDEFLPALGPGRKNAVYREMSDNDPIIGALTFSIEMLIRQVEWRVDPADGASVADMVLARQTDRAQLAVTAAKAARESAAAVAAQEAAANVKAAEGASGSTDSGADSGATSKIAKAERPGTELARVMKALGMDPGRHAPALARLDAVNEHLRSAERVRLVKAAAVHEHRAETWARALHDLRVGADRGDTDAAYYLTRLAKATAPAGATAPPLTPALAPDLPPVPTVDELMAQVAIDGEEDAVFIETCFHDMESSWEDTLSEILSMLVYGYSLEEIVYKRRSGRKTQPHLDSRYSDGMIGWRKFAPRAQETIWRWGITDDGTIEGAEQVDSFSANPTVMIPMTKALLFRTTVRRNNPEGRSILRNAYIPWRFKKRIEEIEAIGIERDLAGFPVAYVPARMMTNAATEAEVASLAEIKEIVSNIKRDEQEGAVFPNAFDPETGNKLYELTLLSTGGSRQFDTDSTVARYDQRIAMTVLADFLLLGHEKVGTFSLGQTKSDLFTSALEAWLAMISQVFNADAIPRLRKINGQDPSASPTLSHGKLNQVDLSALGDFLVKVSQAGAPLFPDDNLEAYLREVAGLPDKAAEMTDIE